MPILQITGWFARLVAFAALAVSSLGAPKALPAQEAATSTEIELSVRAMEPLAWLIGDWSGEGWIQLGPGERHEFTQTEHVERTFGDRLLLVEGIGRARVPGGQGPIVHHAFAVLSWDDQRGTYRFDTYRAGENGVDAEAVHEDGVFTWSFDAPNGKVRFRIHETEDGEWHETGQFSPDQGVTWHPFFEMRLRRIEDDARDVHPDPVGTR